MTTSKIDRGAHHTLVDDVRNVEFHTERWTMLNKAFWRAQPFTEDHGFLPRISEV
jgi:hypothetical protein